MTLVFVGDEFGDGFSDVVRDVVGGAIALRCTGGDTFIERPSPMDVFATVFGETVGW